MLELAQQQTPGKLLMVGDQAFKDVLAAHRAGAISLQVPRRDEGDDWRVRCFQRPVEMGIRALQGIDLYSHNDVQRAA